jgi:hypothetical protein
MLKRLAVALAIAFIVIIAVWTSLVVSYEDGRGTDNTVLLSSADNATSGDSDVLASLSFEGEAAPLLWSSLTVEIEVGNASFACGFGAQSIDTESSAKVQPKLGADGLTFTTVVDATDEEAFTHVDLPRQSVGNESNHTMRFSKTDVFLGQNVTWVFVEDDVFENITEINGLEFSNNTEDRLEWYDYDLAVHRVNPKEGVFVLLVDEVAYKLKFETYYNEADESRHPTMRIAALNSEDFPALSDPALVSPSPCLIVAGDGDLVRWNATESIQIIEHNVDLVQEGQTIVVNIAYEGKSVRIVENQG